MGYWNHCMDEPEITKICPACGKKYRQWTEDQVPGFRDMDYDICPYCGNENGRSMSYEYHNNTLE